MIIGYYNLGLGYIEQNDSGFSFVTLNSTREGYSLYVRNGFDNLEDALNFAIEESDVECRPMYFVMDWEQGWEQG